jgi:hypothetical protein
LMQLRDNSARAKQIISIFWIMLGVTLVNMGSLAWQYFLLADAQADPEFIDMNILETSDMIRAIVSIAKFAIIILSIIFFIMWFRRAYYNLRTLPWHNARYTDGWAAGAWFVPIINLWYPYQIMIDIWRGTQNALKERLGEPQASTIVGWWWALHLISSFYDNISTRFGWNAEGIDELITSTQLDFVGEIIAIPAIIITIVLIKRTSNFEKELLVHSQNPSDSIFSDNYTPEPGNLQPKIEN